MVRNTGSQPDYVPTVLAIWKKTRAIQASWTDEERARRRRFLAGYELPGIRVLDTTLLRRLGVDVGAE